jgi:hypothetical protein
MGVTPLRPSPTAGERGPFNRRVMLVVSLVESFTPRAGCCVGRFNSIFEDDRNFPVHGSTLNVPLTGWRDFLCRLFGWRNRRLFPGR